MKLLLSSISLLAIGKECLSFSPNSIARPSFKPSTKKTTTTTLQAKSYTEDDASYVMEQAQECLDSESCPIDMANMYLHEVIYVSDFLLSFSGANDYFRPSLAHLILIDSLSYRSKEAALVVYSQVEPYVKM